MFLPMARVYTPLPPQHAMRPGARYYTISAYRCLTGALYLTSPTCSERFFQSLPKDSCLESKASIELR